MGIDPVTHRPRADLTLLATIPNLLAAAAANLGAGLPSISSLENSIRLQADSAQLAKEQFIQNLVQVLSTGYNINTTGLPHPSNLIPSPCSFAKEFTTLPNNFQSMNQLLVNNGYNNYNPISEIGECSNQQVHEFSDQIPITQTPVSAETFANMPTMIAGTHVADHQSASTLNLPSYNFQDLNDQYSSLEEHLDRFGVGRSYSQMSSPCTNQTSTASIVSNSPDNLNIDQMHGLPNVNTSRANSSTMNTAEEEQPWGNTNFDDYLSTNFNWNDLLG